tara:strand:- start:5273 stop:5809 length:537 start_codon:yes stop_codon:yes gene_type:complete
MAEIGATNPFWDYSLAVYRGGVVTLCLRLQDDCGVDVNLLLYAAWLWLQGRPLTAEHLAEQDVAVSDWRVRVVQPLRILRRDLREFSPAAALRERLAELELLAERAEQDILFAGSTAAGAPPPGSHNEMPAGRARLHAHLALVAELSGSEQTRWKPLIDALVPLLAASEPGVAPRSSR